MSNSTSAPNVKTIAGEPYELERNLECIEQLGGVLERAKSGEICGVALVAMNKDRTTSNLLVGHVGGFGMVGRIEMLKSTLLTLTVLEQ